MPHWCYPPCRWPSRGSGARLPAVSPPVRSSSAVSFRRHFAQQAVLIVDLHGAARFRLAAQGRGRIVGGAAVRPCTPPTSSSAASMVGFTGASVSMVTVQLLLLDSLPIGSFAVAVKVWSPRPVSTLGVKLRVPSAPAWWCPARCCRP